MNRWRIALLLLAVAAANARSPTGVDERERLESRIVSSEEQFVPMNYVMFESDLPAPARKIFVESRKKDDHLVSLKVGFAGKKTTALSMKALAMFPSPQLETMLVRGPTSVTRTRNYWAVVHFYFGNRYDHCTGTMSQPQFAHAEILFPFGSDKLEIVVYDPCHNVLGELTTVPDR